MRLGRAGSFGLLTVFCARAVLAQAAAPPRSGPPSWAKDAVWYAITVDRFKNGDPRNDPKPADLRGAWPLDPLRDWQLAPWTASWYAQLPAERASGRDFYSTVPTRRYGGDLAGILERLDHFQSLGVNALLLSPVFEAPSALKRDPTFLHHVDNNFGPDPEGDRLVWATESPADPATWKWTGADRFFLRFLQECHRRQIKVVVETALPFVGQTFWAFRDLRARGAASKYAAWFEVTHFDDPATPGDELDYTGQGGGRELPAFKKEGEGLASGPRDHLKTVLKRWTDPNGDGDGSDGSTASSSRGRRGWDRASGRSCVATSWARTPRPSYWAASPSRTRPGRSRSIPRPGSPARASTRRAARPSRPRPAPSSWTAPPRSRLPSSTGCSPVCAARSRLRPPSRS